MSKKKTQPKLLTISFNEGKQRVGEMIDDIYSSLISDIISELQDVGSIKHDGDGRLELLSTQLQVLIKEHVSLQNDLNICYCLADIVELSNKYSIFDSCEEQLVGAFLGQVIIVVE